MGLGVSYSQGQDRPSNQSRGDFANSINAKGDGWERKAFLTFIPIPRGHFWASSDTITIYWGSRTVSCRPLSIQRKTARSSSKCEKEKLVWMFLTGRSTSSGTLPLNHSFEQDPPRIVLFGWGRVLSLTPRALHRISRCHRVR